MTKEKISSLKTSELLDRLNVELKKEEIDDEITGEMEQEIDKRSPFRYIETRFEGSEDEEGLRNQIEGLQKEIKELKSKLGNHDHKDGIVVVRL